MIKYSIYIFFMFTHLTYTYTLCTIVYGKVNTN